MDIQEGDMKRQIKLEEGVMRRHGLTGKATEAFRFRVANRGDLREKVELYLQLTNALSPAEIEALNAAFYELAHFDALTAMSASITANKQAIADAVTALGAHKPASY
jgi:hypothetical protein